MTNLKKKILKHPFFKNIDNLLIVFIISLLVIFYFIMKNIVPIRENFKDEITTTTTKKITAEDIAKFKKELEDSKKKVNELKEEIKKLTADLEKINKEHSDLKTTSEEIKKKLQNDIKELTNTIDKLESINAKSTLDINMLRDEKKQLSEECNSKINKLESKIKELKKINRQCIDIQNFKDTYREHFEDTEDNSTKETTTTTTSKPTRQPLPSTSNETILYFSKIRKLRNKLKEHDNKQNETLKNLQERFNKYHTSN